MLPRKTGRKVKSDADKKKVRFERNKRYYDKKINEEKCGKDGISESVMIDTRAESAKDILEQSEGEGESNIVGFEQDLPDRFKLPSMFPTYYTQEEDEDYWTWK